jgi:hypothetical protein
MKLEFSRQIFEKRSNMKFCQNSSSESRVVRCGLTDGHEADSRFSQFSERAYKTKRKYRNFDERLFHTHSQKYYSEIIGSTDSTTFMTYFVRLP